METAMSARYRMLRNSDLEPKAVAGTVVYASAKHDYGLADDDTRITGVRHISVTLNSDGDYPFFTVPEGNVERLA
jgi:hypothetical protein